MRAVHRRRREPAGDQHAHDEPWPRASSWSPTLFSEKEERRAGPWRRNGWWIAGPRTRGANNASNLRKWAWCVESSGWANQSHLVHSRRVDARDSAKSVWFFLPEMGRIKTSRRDLICCSYPSSGICTPTFFLDSDASHLVFIGHYFRGFDVESEEVCGFRHFAEGERSASAPGFRPCCAVIRNLGIFSFNLIQKTVRYMWLTCMCMCA
jgi:hypothetical protein